MTTKYIVFECQTNADGSVGNLVTAYDDLNQAASAYHTVLAAAAVSALPMHSCTLLQNDMFQVKHECYTHPTPAQETTE